MENKFCFSFFLNNNCEFNYGFSIDLCFCFYYYDFSLRDLIGLCFCFFFKKNFLDQVLFIYLFFFSFSIISEINQQISTDEQQKKENINKDQCHLWVSNIAKETHASDLKELFSKYGKVNKTNY